MHSAETCGRTNIFCTKSIQNNSTESVWKPKIISKYIINRNTNNLRPRIFFGNWKALETGTQDQYSNMNCSAGRSRIDSLSLLSEILWSSLAPMLGSSSTVKMVTFRSCTDTMWNSRALCEAESVAKRLSSHCWTSWLALDKENHWRSTPAVAPDGWVQWALHNPSRWCSLLPLDGAAQNGLGIENSKAFTRPTICGAKLCLCLMITWQAVYSKP